MTNQLNLSQPNENSNWTKIWVLSKVFLIFTLAIMLFTAVLVVIPTVYVFGAGLVILFLLALFLLKLNRKQTVNIKVKNQHIHYFCSVKREKVVVPIQEITKVTSQFCELQIHTCKKTYCLNLNNIKHEKQRWEIKEMIKNLAPNQGNQAVNF